MKLNVNFVYFYRVRLDPWSLGTHVKLQVVLERRPGISPTGISVSNSKTGTAAGIFEHKNDRAGLRPHDQESCYNTHSWSGVLSLAVINVGLSLGLTTLTHTAPLGG